MWIRRGYAKAPVIIAIGSVQFFKNLIMFCLKDLLQSNANLLNIFLSLPRFLIFYLYKQ